MHQSPVFESPLTDRETIPMEVISDSSGHVIGVREAAVTPDGIGPRREQSVSRARPSLSGWHDFETWLANDRQRSLVTTSIPGATDTWPVYPGQPCLSVSGYAIACTDRIIQISVTIAALAANRADATLHSRVFEADTVGPCRAISVLSGQANEAGVMLTVLLNKGCIALHRHKDDALNSAAMLRRAADSSQGALQWFFNDMLENAGVVTGSLPARCSPQISAGGSLAF